MADINNPETLHAALKQKVARAAAEVDDAACSLKRAQGERAETEDIIASMTQHKFPTEHIAIVARLRDPEAQAIAAAQKRHAAAAQNLAAAKQAVAMAAQHVQLQGQGAAGTFYNN